MSFALVEIKIKYIPMCTAGLISIAECSRKIGITDSSVRCLKARFNACGYAVFVHGKYYPVELCEPLCDVVGDVMPFVEKELVRAYLLSDTHDNRAVV